MAVHRVQDMQRMSGPGQKCSEYPSHIPAPGTRPQGPGFPPTERSNYGDGTPPLGSCRSI